MYFVVASFCSLPGKYSSNKNTSVFLKHYDRSKWKRVRLGDIVEYKKGNGLSKEKLSSKGEHECVLYGELFTRYKETIDYVFSKTSYKEGELSVLGDVLMPGSTTTCGEDLAKASAIHHDNVLLGGDIIILRPNNNLLDGDFLAYLIPSYRNELIKYTQGITIIHLQGKKLLDMMICIPDMATQKNIVKNIQTIDVHISDLETLISKQEAIKKSTIKMLLEPKAHWVTKTIGELCDFYTAGSKSAYLDDNGKYFIVDMGSVSTDGLLIATKKTNYQADFLKTNDIIMPKDDIGGGQIIGKTIVIEEDGKYILGDHVYKLTTSINAKFLSYIINSSRINQYMRKMATGSAQLGLSKHSISKCEICFPDQDDEQQRIVTELTKIDKNIKNLKQQLVKQRALKQGLMDFFFGN